MNRESIYARTFTSGLGILNYCCCTWFLETNRIITTQTLADHLSSNHPLSAKNITRTRNNNIKKQATTFKMQRSFQRSIQRVKSNDNTALKVRRLRKLHEKKK